MSVPIANAIEELQKRFKPEAAKSLSATYLIAVNGPGGGAWLTKINDGTCEITPHSEAPTTEPDCKISINSEDLEMIMTGRMSAMTAALSGMLAIEGELGLAMQLVPVFFDSQVPFM